MTSQVFFFLLLVKKCNNILKFMYIGVFVLILFYKYVNKLLSLLLSIKFLLKLLL